MEVKTATPISIQATQAGRNSTQIISTTLVNSRRTTAIDSVVFNRQILRGTIAVCNTKAK